MHVTCVAVTCVESQIRGGRARANAEHSAHRLRPKGLSGKKRSRSVVETKGVPPEIPQKQTKISCLRRVTRGEHRIEIP